LVATDYCCITALPEFKQSLLCYFNHIDLQLILMLHEYELQINKIEQIKQRLFELWQSSNAAVMLLPTGVL